MPPPIAELIHRRLSQAAELLRQLICVPSIVGDEAPAQALAAQAFADLGYQVQSHEVPESIRDDPEYCHADLEPPYAGRRNLVVTRSGSGGGRGLIVQSHTDVVPAAGWTEAFTGRMEGGAVWGRGAVDCKGQVVAIWLAWAALRDLGAELKGDLEAQIVIDEEVGGNGALALIREGRRAQGVLIMECTDLNVYCANRGAIWFRLNLAGKPVHMGRKQEGVSALAKAVVAMELLEQYERRLIEESRGLPLFEQYEHPVQANVGILHSGQWPSMVPGEAILEGGVGFLPNKTKAHIKQELQELFASAPDPWLATHHELSFPKLHKDAYALPADHPLPQALAAASLDAGLQRRPTGWNVSCDAALYATLGGMPTVVFGPGQVTLAHSDREHIRLCDLALGAEILTRFILSWCRGS